ncbi:MAG: class I SAM-dependent methyltransferase [Saprospiraceae bacterium]|nr:class I SAM-dependent methyltransferase [Saprospiraceae bacterium]
MSKSSEQEYLHGFSEEEQKRLLAQNQVLSPDIYAWLDFGRCKNLLEIGCGVGAQMIAILKKYPNIKVTGLDLNEKQITKAQEFLSHEQIDPSRYKLLAGNILGTLPLDKNFDDILLVWVLEHVKDPFTLLQSAHTYLRKGGKIHLTEVYNRSFDLYPKNVVVQNFWNKMDEFQNDLGGNGQIGLSLGNLLYDVGFVKIKTHSHPLFFDKTKSQRRASFLKYWTSLMESSAITMMKKGLISPSDWEDVKENMLSLQKNEDAIFYYSWVQACGEK